jgi:hypothetical protein
MLIKHISLQDISMMKFALRAGCSFNSDGSSFSSSFSLSTHGGFHKWGYPNSWMVFVRENPIKVLKWMI